MEKLRGVIILVTIGLVIYFTFQAISDWDSFGKPSIKGLFRRYEQICVSDNPYLRKYGLGEECISIKDSQIVSDAIIKRAIFLDGITLLTGAFAFIALGKLQPKRKTTTKDDKHKN